MSSKISDALMIYRKYLGSPMSMNSFNAASLAGPALNFSNMPCQAHTACMQAGFWLV